MIHNRTKSNEKKLIICTKSRVSDNTGNNLGKKNVNYKSQTACLQLVNTEKKNGRKFLAGRRFLKHHVGYIVIRAVALQLRAPPKVSARAPAHRSYHFRGVKLKSCIKKIHHNLYISKQANVRIKHADTEGSSHKKFGTDARVQ